MNTAVITIHYLNKRGGNMSTIVTAIDFSKGSIHALDYTLQIANRTKSNIILVWVDNHSVTDPVLQPYSTEFKNEAKQNFEEILPVYQKKLKSGNITYKLRKGKVAQEVAAVAKSANAQMIISGTHGGSGYEEFWIGSNANRIVIMAPCPVITVNHLFDNKIGIHNIVLPIDSTIDTRKKVPEAIKMASIFNAEIHILGVYSTTLNTLHKRVDAAVEKVKEDLIRNEIPFRSKIIDAQNITTATINYVDETNADMIIMMTEQESSSQNRLLGQYAQQMVNLSPVPVLSIHPNYS
ncbi:MAG: universal stress protein [Bacteroidales bacterium]|nr:universal stress protein [Bacteroidales bacterium]